MLILRGSDNETDFTVEMETFSLQKSVGSPCSGGGRRRGYELIVHAR